MKTLKKLYYVAAYHFLTFLFRYVEWFKWVP